MTKLTYRGALFFYVVFFLILTIPYWLHGLVVAPLRQFPELGMIDSAAKDKQLENQKFGDFVTSYIPEISQHLNGKRSGWLTLWTNQNELGRPVYQLFGFSPAYMPSWMIAQVTKNPWCFITVLSLLTCFLAGLFILLFAKETGLNPIAGLIAGTSLAASPVFMYWLTFPMFLAVWCWSAGCLWAMTRLAKKSDILGWSVLAFSSYSLLMTAYQQAIIFHAYLLGGYGLWLAYHQLRISQIALLKFLVFTGSALIVGAALAFPVYRDLIILWSESGRVSPDLSFFTVVVPKFASFAELVRFLVLSTVPEIFGNPIAPSYPLPYNGLSVTIIVIFFVIVGAIAAFKKTWGWWLAVLIICLLTFIYPLYIFGVKYLGFNISRATPFGTLILPVTIIMAYGVDTLTRSYNRSLIWILCFAGLTVLTVIVIGVVYGVSQGIPIHWWSVLGMLLVAILLFMQYDKFRLLPLVLSLATVLIMTSYPLMLKQDPAQIAITSPLVKKIRADLFADSRYAVVTPGMLALQSNLNATIGLASAHSYNSLSPMRYRTLIQALGGEMETYGRWNGSISPNYGDTMFWMSNISLILSQGKLVHENLEYLDEESGIFLYRVLSHMGKSLQIVLPQEIVLGTFKLSVDDLRLLQKYTPIKLVDENDHLEFEVVSLSPSIFILSQKFHRDWQARVLTKEGWRSAQTLEVNGVFQGVLLPAGTHRVCLDFKPLVRYAWIAHIFWIFLLVLLGLSFRRTFRSKFRSKDEKD